MLYDDIAPYLSAFKIVVRDRQYNKLTPEEARLHLLVKIEAGKAKPDELYIMVT